MTRLQYQALYGGWRGDDTYKAERLMAIAGEIYDLKNANAVLIDDDLTITEDDSGKTYNIATDAKTFTLPLISATNLGMKFKFRNTGADDAVALTLSPNALDGINGTIANATADSVASGAVNQDLVNTKTGANNMDYVEIDPSVQSGLPIILDTSLLTSLVHKLRNQNYKYTDIQKMYPFIPNNKIIGAEEYETFLDEVSKD